MFRQLAFAIGIAFFMVSDAPCEQGKKHPGQTEKASETQQVEATPFWTWLMSRAEDADFEELKPYRAIYYLTEIAKACHTVDQDKLANEYLKRAMAIADKDAGSTHYFTLFDGAIDIEQLDVAEKIAKDSENDTMLDQWDLERFRRGEKDAIKDYPRGKMTFYNAMDLARVYVEKGEYDAAEKFVMSVAIEEGNDPKDLAGLIFEDIANRYRDKGDMDNARRYIDKAMDVAGKQFYTGYSIEATHRAIHGRLTEGLDTFAQTGARYPAHMGRELVQRVVYELVKTGHFEEAKQTRFLLKKKEDRDSSMTRIAIEQATRGDITAALKTVDELDDPLARNGARLGIAESIAMTGNTKTAKRLADFILRGMPEEVDSTAERTYQRLAGLYGALEARQEIEQIVADSKTPLQEIAVIAKAISGFAGE